MRWTSLSSRGSHFLRTVSMLLSSSVRASFTSMSRALSLSISRWRFSNSLITPPLPSCMSSSAARSDSIAISNSSTLWSLGMLLKNTWVASSASICTFLQISINFFASFPATSLALSSSSTARLFASSSSFTALFLSDKVSKSDVASMVMSSASKSAS